MTEKMWNVGAELSVKLMGGTPFTRSKVREYAEKWTEHANIGFKFVDPEDAAVIRVAFDQGGSWSTVGRDALWVPSSSATMNFGWFDDTTPETGFSRTVLHEFGHALGLVHEHQSPAAGIAWDREKVYAHFLESAGWDRATVDANVFERYGVTSTNYSAFDSESIMAYWIDASLTLDGKGVVGGATLSNTDKEYVRRWYPQAPVPGRANGLIRTGDDCDEIDFTVDYGVSDPGQVSFFLAPAAGLTWWKAIEVPVGAGEYHMLEMENGDSAEAVLARADVDNSRPLRFWKAKEFGIHRRLDYTWDIVGALPGGSRMSLRWKRDRC
ncbi:M12 family metallopeptidase [Streptosporangium sp. NPDC002721]|uniref:M12 family metallopeptidase n=1 Tax=Streptosporangium sp. NPDC002721 TaxID=3366188 RepID=UPI0036A5EFC9